MKFGISQKISADKFKSGICEIEFDLGNEFDSKDMQHCSTLKFCNAGEVYYKISDDENIMIIGPFDSIPFFGQIETWTKPVFEDNMYKVVLDLRIKEMMSSEFNPNNINDNNGTFGKDFIIEVMPAFDNEKKRVVEIEPGLEGQLIDIDDFKEMKTDDLVDNSKLFVEQKYNAKISKLDPVGNIIEEKCFDIPILEMHETTGESPCKNHYILKIGESQCLIRQRDGKFKILEL